MTACKSYRWLYVQVKHIPNRFELLSPTWSLGLPELILRIDPYTLNSDKWHFGTPNVSVSACSGKNFCHVILGIKEGPYADKDVEEGNKGGMSFMGVGEQNIFLTGATEQKFILFKSLSICVEWLSCIPGPICFPLSVWCQCKLDVILVWYLWTFYLSIDKSFRMAPRNTDSGLEPVEDLLSPEESEIIRREEKPAVVHQQIVWRNLIWLSLLHIGSIYGLFGLTWKCHWYTLIWGKFFTMPACRYDINGMEFIWCLGCMPFTR